MVATMQTGTEQWEAVTEADLPDSMKELAQLIGLKATVTIISTWGDRNVYIAKNRNARLISLVGKEAANILSREYGGLFLQIPGCRSSLRKVRNRAIAKRRHESPTKLAREFNVSIRQAYNLRGEI